jgi:uncharacterized delta-60 repeat protein
MPNHRPTRRDPRRQVNTSGPAGNVEPLEGRLLLAVTTLTNGTGPGSVSVTVDSYGSYQNALYQPVGADAAEDTTFYSAVYASAVDKFLDQTSMPALEFTSAAANTATSTFTANGLAFTLTQTVGAPDANGGTDLVQQYQVTNTTAAPVALTLVRHLDGDLRFAGGFGDDQAGVSADGRFVFEFDDASDPANASGLLGIANSGGDHAGYTIQPYSYTDSITAAHGIPAGDLNRISGDADNNRLTDAGYDVTLSLQNNLTIAAGATQTFTTTTHFGRGAPAEVIAQPAALPSPEQDAAFTAFTLTCAAEAIQSQSDGGLVMACHKVVAPGVMHGLIVRCNPDGTRDTTFGTNGNGIIESAAGSNEAFYSLVVQPDDKLVVSGRSGSDFLIARYNANGTPDTTFGTNGRTLTNFGATAGATAFAVALGPNGTIVLGGGANGAFAFARYTSAGVLDPTFGNGGTVAYDVGTTNDVIAALAVQSDGSIIVAGAGDIGGASVLVTRLTPAGAPDLAFGGGTVVVRVPGLAALTDLGIADATEGLAVLSDNRILIANRTPDGNFGLARLTPEGAADPTFGTSGLAVADFGGDDDADSIILQGNQILVVGTTATGPTGAIAIAAFNPDGTPVSSFGSGGKMVQDTGLGATRTFRSGGTVRKSLASVQTRVNRLVTGASDQSDTESRSSFTRVIVPGSVTETVIGAFGTVAGQRKPAVFVVPGTTVKLSLKGGGSGQVVTDTAKPGQVKLVMTGTTARSALSVKGKQRLTLSDVAADGPMGKVTGKTADLAGTLFVNGPVAKITLGNVAGTASAPATVAASGPIRSLSVLSLSNARVLSGANLGADALVGGGDDTFGAGQIRALKVAGAVAASFIGAGVNPVNGVFGDAGDTLLGGTASSIDKVTAKGGVDAATLFEAGAFGRIRKLGREKVDPATDPRFRLLA